MAQHLHKRDTILVRWARWAGAHPGKALLVAGVITAILTTGFIMLDLEMTFYSIMPASSPKVQDLRRITDEFPFSSAIAVVVDGRATDPQSAKSTVKAVIDEMSNRFQTDEFAEYVSGVYGTIDLEYLRNHGLMLTSATDLNRISVMYEDPDITPFFRELNNDLEREYSGDSAALEEDEAQIVNWVNGLSSILELIAENLEGTAPTDTEMQEALDRYLLGDAYYLSRDQNMGVLFLQPSFTVNNLGPLVNGTEAIDAAAKEIARSYGIKAGLTGLTVVGKDEMVTSEKGFGESMAIAIVLIIGLLILVFRIRSTPVIIGIPLAIGIYWTVGLTGLIIHRLNIMTAMYMVALLGLGVDYAIHMMSAYVQERDSGNAYIDALGNAFYKCGRGILTGAFTTAAAFFVLIVAKSEVVQELAVVASLGILSELAAMMLLVPALIGYRSMRLERKGKVDKMMTRRRIVRSDFASRIGAAVTGKPVMFISILIAVTAVLTVWAPRVGLEDNIMKMEAKGLESVELQDVMVEEFGAAPDALYYLSDNLSELPDIVDRLQDLATVQYVDAVSRWLPTKEQQELRARHLRELRDGLQNWKPADSVDASAMLEELYRLEANLIEMGDLAILGGSERLAFVLNKTTGLNDDGEKVSPSTFDRLFAVLENGESSNYSLDQFQAAFSPLMANSIYRMSSPAFIGRADLPEMVADTFFAGPGDESLVTIAPKENPWVGSNRASFMAQVGTVVDDATGMILAADELTNIAKHDGTRALIAALIIVFIILYIDFRNLKLTVFSFLPLGMSFASLMGVMALAGIRFDFVNIISIPLLVGIGIDDTVHITHRYLIEGPGGMRRTLGGTGTAVLMTTLTTMIGFASFIPSVMRAMRSTGIVLALAMAFAFLYSILFHPAVLILAKERYGLSFEPKKLKKVTER